jgi:hypothetical protein
MPTVTVSVTPAGTVSESQQVSNRVRVMPAVTVSVSHRFGLIRASSHCVRVTEGVALSVSRLWSPCPSHTAGPSRSVTLNLIMMYILCVSSTNNLLIRLNMFYDYGWTYFMVMLHILNVKGYAYYVLGGIAFFPN